MKRGGLGWSGGKNPHNPTCKWIESHLPREWETVYVEPFAGMLGVLLRRKPVRLETVNDLNGRIINWWRVVRDRPDDLAFKLEWTHQRSRVEFEEMRRKLDSSDPVEAALAFTIVVNGSVEAADTGKLCKIYRKTVSYGIPLWERDDILGLRDRLRKVQLESMDAVTVLESHADTENAVIYCDPPYESTRVDQYRCVPDWDALKAALLAQKGRVAVSGFNDDFDCLGWRCETFDRKMVHFDRRSRDRTEKLWMNYDPVTPGLLG